MKKLSKSKLETLSNSVSGRTAKRSYRLLAAGLIAVAVSALALPSCKAWRTITTTASYVQSADSTGAKATITTKTVEEYQGVKKR